MRDSTRPVRLQRCAELICICMNVWMYGCMYVCTYVHINRYSPIIADCAWRLSSFLSKTSAISPSLLQQYIFIFRNLKTRRTHFILVFTDIHFYTFDIGNVSACLFLYLSKRKIYFRFSRVHAKLDMRFHSANS